MDPLKPLLNTRNAKPPHHNTQQPEIQEHPFLSSFVVQPGHTAAPLAEIGSILRGSSDLAVHGQGMCTYTHLFIYLSTYLSIFCLSKYLPIYLSI